MKKISFIFAIALAALTMIFTGCKKEADTVTLGCYIDASSKTYIDGYTPMWNVGDRITVNGLRDNRALTAADINGNSAQIRNVQSSSSYLAFYPYDLARNDLTTVLLERIQKYKEDGSGHQIVEAPMAAYSTTTTLTFHNLCGLLKVHFTNNSSQIINLSRITVSTTSSTYLCGYSNLNVRNSVVDPLAVSGGDYAYHSVTLNLNHLNVAAGATKDFYIYLPAFENKKITVTLNKDAHNYASFTGTVSLAYNTIATLNFSNTDITNHSIATLGAIDGLFTINSNGDQVCFSRGNLQAYKASSSSESGWEWSFADHQWDFIGGNSGNTKLTSTPGTLSSYPGTVDLFAWSTPHNYYGITAFYDAYDDYWYSVHFGYNNFKDWGNTLNNANGTWRTLQASEWEYITGGGENGTPCRSDTYRYLKAPIVNSNGQSVNGMILFPDIFDTTGLQLSTTIPANEDITDAIPYLDWIKLQNAGCVFLPNAGEIGNNGYSAGSFWYWLATPQEGISAYYASGISTGFSLRHSGYPVRLVQDYTPSTSTK